MNKPQILLASGSPRRAMLLEEMDYAYRIIRPDVEEIIPENMPTEEAPAYLAQLKGQTVLSQLGANEILLAADTIVVLDGQIVGKPTNVDHAKETIKRLSGNQHHVITGVYLANSDRDLKFSVKTTVYFDDISDAETDYYISNYKPLDKAGSYGIQEWIGWTKIIRIEGSYSNIIGLPTREVYQALMSFQDA